MADIVKNQLPTFGQKYQLFITKSNFDSEKTKYLCISDTLTATCNNTYNTYTLG